MSEITIQTPPSRHVGGRHRHPEGRRGCPSAVVDTAPEARAGRRGIHPTEKPTSRLGQGLLDEVRQP